MANSVIYEPVPLLDILGPAVDQAFSELSIPRGQWNVLVANSDHKSDYWFQNKFGLYDGKSTGDDTTISRAYKDVTVNAFTRARTTTPLANTGAVIFGCSADLDVPVEQRFARDKDNLHRALKTITDHSQYLNVALLVICYRSPLDSSDLSYSEVDINRTGSSGRRDRIRAVCSQFPMALLQF